MGCRRRLRGQVLDRGKDSSAVFEQDEPDHYKVLANIPTGIGIETGYFHTNGDGLYVGVQAEGKEPAQVWTYGVRRE